MGMTLPEWERQGWHGKTFFSVVVQGQTWRRALDRLWRRNRNRNRDVDTIFGGTARAGAALAIAYAMVPQ